MQRVKVRANHVSKVFHSLTGAAVHALKEVSLEVRQGEFLTIIGPSGAGKSTFLNLVAGLDTPTDGAIYIDDEQVQRPNPRKVALMFQEYTLYPWRNVLKNVEFGLELRKVPEAERRTRARHYLELVGLSEFADKYPRELSGGMKQRVALARSLTLETDLLLMDEPFGSLDEQTRMILGQELISIWQQTHKTILFVTHSLLEAAFLSDRVVVFSARPSMVKRVVEVSVPRPRDIASSSLDAIRAIIWEELQPESLRMARPALTPGAMPVSAPNSPS